MAILALLFIVVPIVEIYLIIEIGGQIGTLNTLAVMVVTAIVGAWLARHQGLVAVRKLQQSLLQGRAVGRSMVEAALVLVAAVSMLTPGFLTDATGLALLVPPIRLAVAELITRRIGKRIRHHPGAAPRGAPHGVIDVEGFEVGDAGGATTDDASPRGEDRDVPDPQVIDV